MLKQKAARQGGGTNSRTPSPLMGKRFDENGESLYACGAKKGKRRCPYFVSRKLVRGADKTRESRWRVSGEEIEPAAMAAARQMLSDRGALASTLKDYGFAAAELKQALEVVDRKLQSVDEIGSVDAAGSFIDRVELKCDGMQMTLNLRALLPPDLISGGGSGIPMTRVVHMQMKRRGVEMRLVIPGEAVAVSRSDPAFLRALSRGYQWFSELASGRAERLKDHARLPIEWDAQQRLLSD